MRRKFRIQNSEFRMKCTVNSGQCTEQGRRTKDEGRNPRSFIVPHSSFIVLLLASGFWLLTPAALRAETHVTAAYDLGANPHVMTTVNGTPEYGLVFAQRNKAVSYNSVEYGPSVVNGYLNASGQLNDGAGNLWLDLIPNLGATPADSYYVVTSNIQGRVHAEIWVLPDVSTIGAESVRQVQPPSATSSGFDLSTATGLLGLSHGGTGQSSWTGGRCVRVNNAASALESAAADCGSGGGSAPIASATVSGTVKTDTTEADPVVYLKTSADTLLAGKAGSVHTHSQNDVTNLTTDLAGKTPVSRNINTSSPLAGGGTLASDLTLSCPTCEVTGNKNAASGYAGLSASSKLTAAQGQEVWGAADLTDYAGTSGTGSTALKATITTPASNDCLIWNGTNWVNSACPGGGGGGDNISVNGTAATDADFDDATPAAPANSINVKWQKDASTPNNLSAYLPYTAPLTVTSGNLDCASASSSAKGCLTSTDWSTFNGKPSLVTSGTAGNGPSKAGDASTAARSNHDHRSIHQLAWYFPGTPATGVQPMTVVFPEGAVNFSILDMRATVNTTSGSSSTVNIQRCTASCTGTSPTFANIYSSHLTLGANTRTAAKAAAPDQNVSSLAAGDQFKANLVTIGSALADVTVTMTVKYDTTN